MATIVVVVEGNVVAGSCRFDESHLHMEQVFHHIDHIVWVVSGGYWDSVFLGKRVSLFAFTEFQGVQHER
jgi:hypothetical protein